MLTPLPQVQPIQPAPALAPPAVVVTNPAPATKAPTAPVPITCSETPTVSQLVSSESHWGYWDPLGRGTLGNGGPWNWGEGAGDTGGEYW